jgi:hypothetical protein
MRTDRRYTRNHVYLFRGARNGQMRQKSRAPYFPRSHIYYIYNEELHNLYRSPKIFRMIKSRRMRLAGHVARILGEEECI